ncbi:MAG TPA: response regulator transcription factor [Bryobacteraceae bacterium]|nr:response regulator transcription factor [Bryobacteraceae bacterium]
MKKTIVLADEQTLFREGTAALCEATRLYRVAGQCADGRSAVRMIGALRPDVSILDLGLSKLYALSVIQKLHQKAPDLKFLVLGMRRDNKTVLEVLRAGASGYLLKSDSVAVLLQGLREILAGSICISPQFEAAKIFRSTAASLRQESYDQLSAREYQVFTLLIQGLRGKEIADRLDLSQKTVSTYRFNLMNKLNIYDVPGLVKLALRKKLIPIR